MESTYKYTALDDTRRQIRLLHLQPSVGVNIDAVRNNEKEDSATAIHCTFSLASLDDNPSYEALSYVWGTSKTTATILLHEHDFSITENLQSILRHLRYKDRERVLWIDALCIHQSDTDERSHQVAEMHRIYSQAWRVVAYLGEAWEGCDTAIHLMTFLENNYHLHWTSPDGPSISSSGFDVHSRALYKSIARIFTSPWWTRVWTVQEYILAQRVVFMCGHHMFDARRLRQSVYYLLHHGSECCITLEVMFSANDGATKFTDLLSRAVAFYQMAVKTQEMNRSILDIVAMFRSRVCLDPRDKIYGLLGIMPNEFRASMSVDYDRSTQDVYKDITIAASKSSLEFLSFSGGCNESFDRLPGLPSWTQDVSASVTEFDMRTYLNRLRVARIFYRASRTSSADFKIHVLIEATTKAMILDTVRAVTSFPAPAWLDHVWSTRRDFMDACRYISTPSTGSAGPYALQSDAFWRTFCGDITGKKVPEINPRKLLDAAIFEEWAAWYENEDDQTRKAKMEAGISEFHVAFRVVSAKRLFAATSKGHIGWLPAHAREGDVIVIMPGGNVPYVLRQVCQVSSAQASSNSSAIEHRYEFVGDAYIHGVMHGEAYDEAKLEAITLV